MKRIAWFAFFLFLAVSCLDEPDCYQLNNNTAVAYFKIIGGGTDKIAEIKVTSPATDAVLDTTNSSSVNLTLNPVDDQTTYSLSLDETTVYDLRVSYKTQVQFVSSDCGERYIFSTLNAVSSTADSLRVVNPTPFKSTEVSTNTNIDIYRCPVTNTMEVKFATAVTLKSIEADYNIPAYSPPGPITAIGLPLNAGKTSTKFTFTFKDETKKILNVSYAITPRTLASMCGEQKFLHNIKSTETTGFTAVKIVEDSIHDLPVVNFEITP